MLSETRFIADITLKSIAAIAGLLLFAGLISRGQSPTHYPATQTHPSAMAAIVQ